jgi:hypothetical protein
MEAHDVIRAEQELAPYFNSGSSGQSDLVKSLTSNSDITEQLRVTLLDLRWSESKQDFISTPDSRPLIGETGAKSIVTFVSSQITRNTTLSNITTDKVIVLAQEAELAIHKSMRLNFIEWGVKIGTWEMVRIMAGNAVFSALSRSKEGGEIGILGGNTKTLKHIQQTEGTQKIIESSGGKFGLFK